MNHVGDGEQTQSYRQIVSKEGSALRTDNQKHRYFRSLLHQVGRSVSQKH